MSFKIFQLNFYTESNINVFTVRKLKSQQSIYTGAIEVHSRIASKLADKVSFYIWPQVIFKGQFITLQALVKKAFK